MLSNEDLRESVIVYADIYKELKSMNEKIYQLALLGIDIIMPVGVHQKISVTHH